VLRRSATSEIRLDDPRVRPDVGWRTLGDHFAVVQHRHAVADVHDDPHIVLDQQDGKAKLGPQTADE